MNGEFELIDPILNISEKELFYEINLFEIKGFQYLQEWRINNPITPNRFQLPSGKILDEDELLSFFNIIRPEFGNLEHIEIRNCLRYYNLINSPLYNGMSKGYCSFLNAPDEFDCLRKYTWKARVKFS